LKSKSNPTLYDGKKKLNSLCCVLSPLSFFLNHPFIFADSTVFVLSSTSSTQYTVHYLILAVQRDQIYHLFSPHQAKMSENNEQSNKFKLAEAPQRVQEAMERFNDAKRNASQLGTLTSDELPPPAKQPIMRNAVESIIEATLQAKQKELWAAEMAVAVLNEEWHAGSLDFTQNEFQSEIEKLERLITALKGDVVVIRTSRHELSGGMMDEMIWRQDNEIANWAYLDLLISRYKTPEGARLSLFASRDTDAQQRFQKNVLKAYDADDGIVRWCVISGQWHPAEYVTTAHIVRYNVGEPSARHLFGPSNDKDGHLMAVKNGMPMHEMYEKAFDAARLIIVPDGDPENGR
jgi:hypothetical protein